MAEYTGSAICSAVPQPCEGRCWNSPSESRSPPPMLRSFDSCIAVARAMVSARSGRSREAATAPIVAALAACCCRRSSRPPPPRTVHTVAGPAVTARNVTYPATAAHASNAAPYRTRRRRRGMEQVPAPGRSDRWDTRHTVLAAPGRPRRVPPPRHRHRHRHRRRSARRGSRRRG
ncbi:protein of unknown function [Streptantibioticus cattleyicolor NRRL 8057 = DSM 46488]|nr:protein of unknown function [Streptantibioticus cattleyicolor NRRL 8057 = DSM 46488]